MAAGDVVKHFAFCPSVYGFGTHVFIAVHTYALNHVVDSRWAVYQCTQSTLHVALSQAKTHVTLPVSNVCLKSCIVDVTNYYITVCRLRRQWLPSNVLVDPLLGAIFPFM